MFLHNLPVEVGIIIFTYLDTRSKINAYGVLELRQFFASCHVKKVTLSRSALATIKSLKLDLFHDFPTHIEELNLSGIQDLTANELIPHVQTFVNLKTLDLTFTNIYLPDLIDLCTEKLRNISINFFKWPRRSKRDDIWNKSAVLFNEKKFDAIHFVVFDLFDADSPLVLLKDVTTKDLKVTVADNYTNDRHTYDEDMPLELEGRIDTNFNKLTYLFRNCRVTHQYSGNLRGISNLNYKQIEYMLFMYSERIDIYVSPLFESVFSLACCDLKIEIFPQLPMDFMVDGNIVFKAWDKSTTFNETFFNQLHCELKNYFPTFVCIHGGTKMAISKAPSDWYCIDTCKGSQILDLPQNVTLTRFCRKASVMRSCRPVGQTNKYKNVTFLRLSDIPVNQHFFLQCKNLHTLDLEIKRTPRNLRHLLFINFIDQASNLKNIRFTSNTIDYSRLFDALSRCSVLENIHICEYAREEPVEVAAILFVIEKCRALYSLFMEVDMSPCELTLTMAALREKAQLLERDHLCIEVCGFCDGWNPFDDVFNPSPLDIRF